MARGEFFLRFSPSFLPFHNLYDATSPVLTLYKAILVSYAQHPTFVTFHALETDTFTNSSCCEPICTVLLQVLENQVCYRSKYSSAEGLELRRAPFKAEKEEYALLLLEGLFPPANRDIPSENL